MPVAVALWSLVVKPGKPEVFQPIGDLRITNVALGHELADQNARTSLKFTYNKPTRIDDDDEEDNEEAQASTVLCSLTPGKVREDHTYLLN